MNDRPEDITLSATNLAIGYQEDVLAEAINFNIKKGQLVGVLGLNGAGKSTLLRTLLQLEKPLAGSIAMSGKPVASYPPEIFARKVSAVLTQQVISKNLSVFELVSLGRQPYANWYGRLAQSDDEIVRTALRQCELEPIAGKKCYELSDGQLQRVLIARALAQDTELMLLDEPSTHLDLHHKAQLLKLLKTISQTQGKSVLYATHDIEYALSICDVLLVLSNNTVVQGSPKQLIEEGVFASFFPKSDIYFDPISHRFLLNK